MRHVLINGKHWWLPPNSTLLPLDATIPVSEVGKIAHIERIDDVWCVVFKPR